VVKLGFCHNTKKKWKELLGRFCRSAAPLKIVFTNILGTNHIRTGAKGSKPHIQEAPMTALTATNFGGKTHFQLEVATAAR